MDPLSLFASPGSPVSIYAEAAATLDIPLVIAGDGASSLAPGQAIGGVIALDWAAALQAARIAEASGVSWHSVDAVRTAAHAVTARGRWLAAGLPCAWFMTVPEGESVASLADRVRLPCVVRSATGAFSTLVETLDACEQAVAEARRQPQARGITSHIDDEVLLEAFVPGDDYILDAVMDRGTLHVLAIFEADARSGVLSGATRTFVTPPALTVEQQRWLAGIFAHAALALGLHHGPLQGTCRANEAGLFIVDVVPYPVSFPFSSALQFLDEENRRSSFEEFVVRHACGQALDAYAREGLAAGVAIVTPPGDARRVTLRSVADARQVRFIHDIHACDKRAHQGQREGACVMIAKAVEPLDVIEALAAAEQHLSWERDEPASSSE